jgi:putative phosphoesterase
MRIAVLSDTHDHLEHLRRALQRVQGCEVLLFCGDLCAPFTLHEMAAGFAGTVHTVLGNNDADVLFMTQIAQRDGNIVLHGDYAELELAGQHVAMVHYPRMAEGLAALGDYDLVCHGHDHQARQVQVGKTLLLNPGEVMGWKGHPTCAIYDTAARKAEIIEL